MMLWLRRLAFVGLVAGVVGFLWNRMNANSDDDDFDDEIPLEFAVPSSTDMAWTGAGDSTTKADTGDGPGADLQPSVPLQETTAPARNSRESAGQDDLTVIRGIGPVFQKRLHDAGVKTFRQLAEMTPAQLEAAGIEGVGVDLDSWVDQARAFDSSRTDQAQ